MSYLKLILSILFLSCSCWLFAEESNYLFRHYQVENGLSDNMVTCCVQDKDAAVFNTQILKLDKIRAGFPAPPAKGPPEQV